jgi:hypothetical protein
MKYSAEVIYTTIAGEAYNSRWNYGYYKSKTIAKIIAKLMAFVHDKFIAPNYYGIIWKINKH